jgi:hypothetical protein
VHIFPNSTYGKVTYIENLNLKSRELETGYMEMQEIEKDQFEYLAKIEI